MRFSVNALLTFNKVRTPTRKGLLDTLSAKYYRCRSFCMIENYGIHIAMGPYTRRYTTFGTCLLLRLHFHRKQELKNIV